MNTPQIIELHNQRLLTTEQLADFYGTTVDRIKQGFNRNKDKFIEGKHFYRLEGQELREFKDRVSNSYLVGKNANSLILYTKQGAGRHSKILNTDRAWDMFDELEENYFNPKTQQFNIPTTLPEALRLSADLAEKNQVLEQQLLEVQPKLNYLDIILSSKDTVTITQIAADYGMSAREMNKVLHKLGIQHKVGGQWILYKKHMRKGYTKSHTNEIPKADGRMKVVMNTKWTQKGRIFLYNYLKDSGYYPQIDLEVDESA